MNKHFIQMQWHRLKLLIRFSWNKLTEAYLYNMKGNYEEFLVFIERNYHYDVK